ncbi:unnamed protein product [Gongylonema pulchrum]|uniref:BZIP domain-containing protein n=1 Tax=Gongylonema pulchrum TaxID=637853 RepID=A0A183E0S4_9BILA|nr:unnamed protein product [Gongylonema pulchrum]
MFESFSTAFPELVEFDYATNGTQSVLPELLDAESQDFGSSFWQQNSITQHFSVGVLYPSVVFVETAEGSNVYDAHIYGTSSGLRTDFGCTNENCSGVSSACTHSCACPTEEEIFEEIARECGELERRSLIVQGAPSDSNLPAALSEHSCYASELPAVSSKGAVREHLNEKPVRGVEKRKERNRAAALRYRERKKWEREIHLNLVGELLMKNDFLKTKFLISFTILAAFVACKLVITMCSSAVVLELFECARGDDLFRKSTVEQYDSDAGCYQTSTILTKGRLLPSLFVIEYQPLYCSTKKASENSSAKQARATMMSILLLGKVSCDLRGIIMTGEIKHTAERAWKEHFNRRALEGKWATEIELCTSTSVLFADVRTYLDGK